MAGTSKRVARRIAIPSPRAGQLDAGDEGAWSVYLEVARTLAAILPVLAPGQHRLLTTADLAAQLGVSVETALGILHPALEHGRLFRWRTAQGIR
jgi:hypothetical protein